MFDVGFSEIIFFSIIAIIVLGPNKFPEAIRYIAKLKVKYNVLKNSVNQTIHNELELSQLKSELNHEILNVQQLEKKLNDYFIQLEQQENNKDKKLYYPVENYDIQMPFSPKFVLNHLVKWSCFRV